MRNGLKALVTGGTGFVGSHLVELLLERGFNVTVLIRKTSNKRWLEGLDVSFAENGFEDKEALKEVVRNVDYVFHVAGIVRAKNSKEFYKGNVETTKNLIEAIIETNNNLRRLLVVSSFAANGPAKSSEGAKEEETPQPITHYGKSKLEEEKLVHEYMEKLPITIVRPPAVYGPRDTDIYLIFKAYNSGLMTFVGFDKKLVSLVHVKDLVSGIYLAATSEVSIGKTYCIGSEKFYTWEEVADILKKVFGKGAFRIRLPHWLVYVAGAVSQFFSIFKSRPSTFNFEKAKDFVSKYQICDISKAKNELGYQPRISLEEGIKETVGWYREMKWL